MGTQMRLKASFDISGFPPDDQVILTALKQYGLIVADNGGAMFISGAPHERWNNDLDQLKTLAALDFEVALMEPVYTPDNVPTGPSPVVSSFTADPPTITAGESSTLSWRAANAIYSIVSPEVGPSRETSAVVQPTVTNHLQALRD